MKLLALDITNLTDARYFAAMGASYICFDPEHISIEQISAMIPWLDVPEFMLQYVDRTGLDNIWEHSHKTGIKNIVLGRINSDLPHPTAALNWTFLIENLDQVHKKGTGRRYLFALNAMQGDSEKTFEVIRQLAGEEVFIEVGPDFHPDEQLLQKLHISGIFVRGGEEEKTGVKSFDALDETLEYYQDLISFV